MAKKKTPVERQEIPPVKMRTKILAKEGRNILILRIDLPKHNYNEGTSSYYSAWVEPLESELFSNYIVQDDKKFGQLGTELPVPLIDRAIEIIREGSTEAKKGIKHNIFVKVFVKEEKDEISNKTGSNLE